MDDSQRWETAKRLTRRYDFFRHVQHAGVLAVGTCVIANIGEMGYYFSAGQPNSSVLNVMTLGTMGVMVGSLRFVAVGAFEAGNSRHRCIAETGFDPEYEIEDLDKLFTETAPSP